MTALPDGHGGPHVFVDDLERPQLTDDDRHHLERVLRVRAGDPLTVSDGAGRWRAARFGGQVEPDGPVHVVAAPEPPIRIAFALTKGGRPELVVQKLTELGADVIAPMTTERAVVRWDPARSERNTDRLRRIAREAAMQCRRVRLPEVAPLTTFAAAAARDGATLLDRGGAPPSLRHGWVLVGPEGGWSDGERRLDLPRMALAETVLRAETAAVAAAAVLGALRARLCAELPVSTD